MNLYVREINSPIEIFDYKDKLKKINSKKNKFIKKILKKLLKIIIRLQYESFFINGNIKEKQYNQNIQCLIPVKENNRDKIVNKCINKIDFIIKNKNIDNILISEKLKKIDLINKNFIKKNYIEGKFLLKIMINDVIRYICDIQKENIENQTIYIMVNGYTRFNLDFIEQLTLSVKNVNVITKNLKKFLIFASKLYNKYGIMVVVSNNKRKALERARIIINIDFSEENLKNYNINRRGIFINLKNEKIKLKCFSGIIINGLKIKNNIDRNVFGIDKYNLFNITDIYESFYYNIYDLQSAKEKLKKDNIEIEKLIGMNGEIDNNDIYTC